MEEAIKRHDPQAVVVPNLVTGFTDATHWKKLGTKCYGFSPLKLPADVNFKNLFHGHDERIPLEGFRFGLEVLFETVEKLVT
jgi:acetylornithine deacetylase/succinyl-diaminopimelate desuccinylase-like protein